MGAAKKQKEFIIKFIISAGLLAVIIANMDLHLVKEILLSLHVLFFLAAVLLLSTEVILMALRTQSLCLTKQIHVPLWVLVKLNLVSVFVGTFLPSKLGIDVLRIYYLSKYTDKVVDSVSTIAVDRGLNIVVMTFFAMGGYFFGGYLNILPSLSIVFIPFVAGIIFLSLFFIPAFQSRIDALLGRIKLGKSVRSLLDSMTTSIKVLIKKPGLFAGLLVFIFVFQVVRSSTSYYFCRSLYIDLPYLYIFVIIPIITMLGMLPFSVAGLGIDQGSKVVLFGLMGVSIEQAFSFSMLVYVSRLLVTLPGLYFFYKEGLADMMNTLDKGAMSLKEKYAKNKA